MMDTRPTAEDFAACTRRYAEAHTTWDVQPTFAVLHWDDERITAHTATVLTGGPEAYKPELTRAARKELKDGNVCGLLLFMEVYDAGKAHEMSDTQLEQLVRDRTAGTVGQRPDAVEKALTHVTALDGRMWTAVEERANPGVVEVTYAATEDDDTAYTGHIGMTLREVAEACRVTLANRGRWP